MVIHRMMIGRKKRVLPVGGEYCGQTTPTARISAIMSSRTLVSHSNHSRRVNVCSMRWKRGLLPLPSPTLS